MTTTDDSIKIPEGATHMLIVCDTFSHEDYTVFAFGESDLKAKKRQYNRNMQRINQIIPLGKIK